MLNDRKTKILEAIINDYIATAEPIGSRTIAKKYDFGISSATIRNEMSDLEEMGYIVQPHTSAGRVPSDKGYRLYVDRLMHYRELTGEETDYLRSVIVNNISHMEYLMRETAKAISLLTNYTTIATEPEAEQASIKHIQLLPVDESSIALVLIMDNKVIKNQLVSVDRALDYETLSMLSTVLNEALGQRRFSEIAQIEIEGGAGDYSGILIKILDTIKEIVRREDSVRVYTSGVNNILEYPEFSDLEKAKGLFKAFEEKDILITLLGKNNNENIQVVIGSENSLEQMKDCSIIKANYMYGQKSLGAVGIIGPTRMDYAQVASVLYGIAKNVNTVLHSMAKDFP